MKRLLITLGPVSAFGRHSEVIVSACCYITLNLALMPRLATTKWLSCPTLQVAAVDRHRQACDTQLSR